jgi:hypothetical protein
MRTFLIKLLGGKPGVLKPDEFTENSMRRSVEDIKLSVVETRDGRQINVSAWNPEIALNLYRQVEDYLAAAEAPEEKQIGVE